MSNTQCSRKKDKTRPNNSTKHILKNGVYKYSEEVRLPVGSDCWSDKFKQGL